MRIRSLIAKSILTPQRGGFLQTGELPFTHSLSWAAGCGLGKRYCGAFCYARSLPNWLFARQSDEGWGEALIVKSNAPELLAAQLARHPARQTLRIFCSPVTDPYQPIERKLRLTRRCLQVFAQYEDLDLLLLHTRAAALLDDLDLLAQIPYVWLGMTIETDRGDLPYGPTSADIERRFAAIEQALARGIRVQIAVAPCLPHTVDFAARLLSTGAQRIVIDSFGSGDGRGGTRTASSPFAQKADYDWRDERVALALYEQLRRRHEGIGWSAAGFAGIPGCSRPCQQRRAPL